MIDKVMEWMFVVLVGLLLTAVAGLVFMLFKVVIFSGGCG